VSDKIDFKKGQRIFVADSRKGSYQAIAGEDFTFDPESKENYPIILDQEVLHGLSTEWYAGEKVPCCNGLAVIRLREGDKDA
jgi:hypothetical protein